MDVVCHVGLIMPESTPAQLALRLATAGLR